MKFSYGDFNKETGISTVTLFDKYGIYTGLALLHPDDEKYPSEYTGCSIAEQRAWIKALQGRRSRAKIKLNAIKNLLKDIEINYHQPIDSKLLRRFSLKIRDYNNEIKDINNQIKEIRKNIKERIEIRDKIIKRGQKQTNTLK